MHPWGTEGAPGSHIPAKARHTPAESSCRPSWPWPRASPLSAPRGSPTRRLRAGPRHQADGETRTPDLLLTKQLLYQLSYVGAHRVGTRTTPPRPEAPRHRSDGLRVGEWRSGGLATELAVEPPLLGPGVGPPADRGRPRFVTRIRAAQLEDRAAQLADLLAAGRL